ncbi:hypothetical protein DE146DRAFT_616944 [Phaeosphaeria sp. MPI-PUGE-AT-0046c]|nr:hypothetical protein DE146DRAFT_616944 [Phaeosphaeria sp. MPI-PUGE-AT-0046c]
MELKKIADETKEELPNVLSQLPYLDAMDSSIFGLKDIPALDAAKCPRFTLPGSDADAGKAGTRVKVFDMDTFDAAIKIAPDYTSCKHLSFSQTGTDSTNSTQEDQVMKDISRESNADNMTLYRKPKPVAVLNLASERKAGGGWANGALAQEEALCYRSSLYLSLHDSYYPLPSLSAIYSPSVLIIRDAIVAALRRPTLTDDMKHFKNEGQRAETKRKIRLTLRVAATGGHVKIVLGALGCGVFGNPPKEVADCFLEVLREKEFQGGWWDEVVFAVLDNVKGDQGGKDGIGNYGEFYRVLDGEIV